MESPRPEAVRGVTEDAIRVGTYGPLTGPAAAWGVMLRSLQAYLAHINESGGVHGRKIELLIEDDQYDPAKTETAVKKLVDSDQVFAVLGGVGSTNGRRVSDFLEERGIPFVTPASGDVFFTEPPRKNTYTVYPRYRTEGQLIGEYIGRELRSLKVGVLHQEDDFGRQGADGITRGLRRFGRDIHMRASCLPTDTDLSPQVAAIIEQMPEVLVIFTAPRQAILAVQALEAKKRRPHILTSFVLSDESILREGGALWEGTVTSAVTKLAYADDPSVAHFREVLKKQAPDLPSSAFAVAGFQIAMPFVEALERAGRELTPEKLYAAFETLRDWEGGGPHWTGGGLGPPVTFGPGDHLGVDKLYFAKAEKGQWVKVSDWIELSR
ncbi:MAG: ABC transporter substrate-binding protein [Deltaproteobacteria bacterium]|nr:ABC transporter substrate-binding protein [Deltaproteobacteria bacterium]